MSRDETRDILKKTSSGEQYRDSDAWDKRVAQGGLKGMAATVGKRADQAFAWTRRTAGFVSRPLAQAGIRESDRIRGEIDEKTKDVKERFTSKQARMARARNLNSLKGKTSYQERIGLLNAIAEEDGGKGLTALREEMPEFFDSLIKTASGRSPDTIKNVAKLMPELILSEEGDFTAIGKEVKDNILPDLEEKAQKVKEQFEELTFPEAEAKAILDKIASDIKHNDVKKYAKIASEKNKRGELFRESVHSRAHHTVTREFAQLPGEAGSLMSALLKEADSQFVADVYIDNVALPNFVNFNPRGQQTFGGVSGIDGKSDSRAIESLAGMSKDILDTQEKNVNEIMSGLKESFEGTSNEYDDAKKAILEKIPQDDRGEIIDKLKDQESELFKIAHALIWRKQSRAGGVTKGGTSRDKREAQSGYSGRT